MKEDKPFIPKDLVEYQKSQIEKLTPINPESMKKVLEDLDTKCDYSSKDYMSCILAYFFGNISPKQALEKISRIKAPTYICGKPISKADIMWTCADCSKLGSCTCYCHDCFDLNKHQNHKYSYQVGTVGCCDCGDENAVKSESFCGSHQLSARTDSASALLPEHYQVYGPIIWSSLVKLLHLRLCQISPDDFTAPPSRIIPSLTSVLLLLSNIFKISPLFHHFVADALLLYFPEHTTTHACSLEDDKEGTGHQCSCSVLDNVIKFLLHLVENKQVSEFLAQLCKVHRGFGVAFLKAFWRNYAYIIRLTNKRQQCFDFLDKILWQVNQVNDSIKEHLPQFADVYFKGIESTVEQIVGAPGNFDETKHTIALGLLFDYQYFYNKDGILTEYLITKAKFLPRFTATVGKLQYRNNVTPLTTHILYEQHGVNVNIARAICYLTEIFNHTIKYYAFNNSSTNSELFSLLFKEMVKDQYDEHNKELTSNCNTPLFRVFVIALAGYIQKNQVYSPQEVLERLCKMASMEKMEVIKVLEYAVKRTVKGLKFIAEIEAGYWVYYGEAVGQLQKFFEDERRYSLIYFDIALIQLVSSMLPNLEIPLLEWLGIDLLLGDTKKEEAEDPLKTRKLLEKLILYLSQFIFNDLAATGSLLRASMSLYRSEPTESTKEVVEYAIRKETALTVLKEEEKLRLYEMLCFDLMAEALPSFLRVTGVESYISPLFELNSSIKSKVAYKITERIKEYFNVFNITSTKGFGNADYNIRAMKKVPNFSIDPFAEGRILPFQKDLKAHLMRKVVLTENTIDNLVVKAIKKEKEIFKSDIVQVVAFKFLYEIMNSQPKDLLNEGIKSVLRIELQKASSDTENAYSDSVKKILELLSQEPHAKPVEESKRSENPKLASIKERQKKIAEEFMKKQQSFAVKNQDKLKEVASITKDSSFECCSYCKESISKATFHSKPFGYLCFLTTSGIYRKAYINTGKMVISQALPANIPQIRPHTIPERCKIFHSCGHIMHLACFEVYCKNSSLKIHPCPLCKNPFNAVLPALESPAGAVKLQKEVYAFFEPFHHESQYEPLSLQVVLIQFMDLFCVTLSLIDLTSLHFFLSTKQKYLKSCVDCILTILSEEAAAPTNRYFDDCNRAHTRSLPLLSQAMVVSFKVFGYLFANYAKNSAVPADLHTVLLNNITSAIYVFLLQSGVKHYLLAKNNELDKDELAANPILNQELKEIFITKRTEVEKDLIPFLQRMIFLKSVLEKWDYPDPSFDRIRNVISSALPESAAVAEFYKILGINADPISYLSDKLTNSSTVPYYAKTIKLYDFFKKLVPYTEKKISPDIGFFMCTTSISFDMIKLPNNYSDLFRQYYPLPCKHCRKSEQTKCLCLLCGEIVCANSPCCKFSIQKDSGPAESIGELTYHTISCCGGSGVFLYLYCGTLIIQSDKLGVQTVSFYLNQFGKDISTYCKTNGPPFYSTEFEKYRLNEDKYQYLRNMLAMGKEKYEIWQEINKGSGIVRGNVQIILMQIVECMSVIDDFHSES
eukprot:TRINITY_DN136395_c0_g1_i1.p1 TRINITY_DN136395_c0_g1~~TRINITY_DN136395_c0_g1_i1.p1  ORF type:complete len:1552 (+),score=183.09 TRINITY_DN136395_c0_g1_i1:80-4657(+)